MGSNNYFSKITAAVFLAWFVVNQVHFAFEQQHLTS